MSLISSIQFSCSVMSDSLRTHGLHAAYQASLSITNSRSLFKLMSIESVMPSNHLILCHPLLLLPSILPSIKWPKYWSFSFSISPCNEYSGLISFRMNWLDLLAVQGTFKSLPTSYFKSINSLVLSFLWASLLAQLVKNPPAVWEIWIQSQGWENLLVKGKVTHSNTLAWRIPWIL